MRQQAGRLGAPLPRLHAAASSAPDSNTQLRGSLAPACALPRRVAPQRARLRLPSRAFRRFAAAMATPAPLTVVHVTDLHLYADEARVNDGLVPAKSCAAVLAAAVAAAPSPDAVLLTGDFTNDDTEASYHLVKRLVRAAWPQPTRVFFVPGNHEDVALLERVFCPDFVGPAASAPFAQAPLGPGWRLALLSSFMGAGAVAGALPAEAVAALDACLSEAGAAGDAVLVAVHHPPLPPCGEVPPWAGNCLLQPEALLGVLGARREARVLLHGHLHADVAMRLGAACDAYCTPSTCTQTLPASPQGWVKDEGASPGFRLLRLLPGGAHRTEVRRVDVAHCKAAEGTQA